MDITDKKSESLDVQKEMKSEDKNDVTSKAKNDGKSVYNLFPIGNGKYVKITHYRKKPYVNIRDYTTTFNGKLYATKRGILLHPQEWNQLVKSVKEVDQELKLVI
jgi:hypothetical protein